MVPVKKLEVKTTSVWNIYGKDLEFKGPRTRQIQGTLNPAIEPRNENRWELRVTENKRTEESRSTRRRAKRRRLRSHLGAQHPRKPAAEEQPGGGEKEGGEEDRKASLSLTALRPSSLHFQTVCSHLDMEFSEVRSLGDRTVLKLRLGCDTAGKGWCNVELKQRSVSEIIRRDKRSSPVTWWTFFTVDLSFWEPSLGPPILQQQCQRSPPGCC